MYVSWVLGDKLRIVMSSIMRWRRGEIGLVIGRLLSVGRHERAILADRTPPTDDTTPIGTADGPKAIYGRRSLSKPPKPTILDLSHRPHHRRLSHERAILADRTPPTDDPTPIGTANGPKAIYGRRSLSKPPKPTILDLSHRPHHRRLPRQRFSATGDYGTSRRPRSFRLDVRRADHLCSLLGFFGNERFEIGRRATEDNPAQVHELCLQFGIGEASIDLLVELVDDPGRCPCRCAEAEIAARLIARHEFAHGRKVRQRVRARGRAHRKRAQPPRPDVLDRGRHGVETDLHLSGEKID